MVRTINPDCVALGHDWDWGTDPCPCGQPHTYRICVRCLTSDDPVCTTDTGPEPDDDELSVIVVWPWLPGGLSGLGKRGTAKGSEVAA